MNKAPPLLELRGLAKAFGPTQALGGVDFTLQRGEVHALIGENGAGKSTLIKIVSGALKPDRGEIFLGGEPFRPENTLAARRQGIATIYQELSLAPHLTAVENIMLGQEIHALGLLKRRDMEDEVRRILQGLKHPEIPLAVPVRLLNPALQQVVEIARALVRESRIIIMDEPTSSLAAADMETLFGLVRRLRDQGIGVIYISHFLEEVLKVADRFTVLRDGRHVFTGACGGASISGMIGHMLGRRLDEMFPRAPRQPGEPLLELSALSGPRLPLDVSLTLHRGEILGLTGLVGSGRTELLQAVFGLAPVRSGAVRIKEIRLSRMRTPRMVRLGVGYLSENRKEEGLAVSRSLRENIALGNFRPFSRCGWINGKKEKAAAGAWMQRLAIAADRAEQAVETLSGGNQQKVALARLLHADADILLLDEPSRGIDIKTKAQIYRIIAEQAAAGKGVIMVSSYFPELLGLCQRIAVMHRGRIAAVRPAGAWDEQSLLAWASLGQSAAGTPAE